MVEIFSDADWADRETRRSVSGAEIYVGGCLAYSSSRTQKIVSLSSAESECSCVGHHGCDLDHNHLFMASPMSFHVFVSGFISSKRCSFLQRCRSFEAFVMQDLVDAGVSHGKRLLVRCTQPCRHCQRLSAARLESLCYFLAIWRGNNLERKQSGRSL